MNGNRMIRMAIVVCVAILVIAVSVQAAGLLDGSLFGYAHAEKYTAGDADIGESVCALDIHWENGKVNLEYYSGEKIELRESSSRPISEDMKMRWWLDGDTLRVQYAKSGLHFGWNQGCEKGFCQRDFGGYCHADGGWDRSHDCRYNFRQYPCGSQRYSDTERIQYIRGHPASCGPGENL